MFRKRSLMYVLAGLVVASVVTSVAVATNGKSRFEATLAPIPHNPTADGGSNVTGTATLKVDGTQVHVNIHVRGLTPNLPHAMHIHGILGDANVCPPAGADTNGDGLVSLEEGAPFYGPIDTSFTETGDTSAASGLALERFPVADANGNLNYNRTFTIPQNVLDSLGSLHIVVHGLALDGNAEGPVGGYDTLFEAVLPVACGTLSGS
jgi:CHRD domain